MVAKLTGRVLTVLVRDKGSAEAGALPGTALDRLWKTWRRYLYPDLRLRRGQPGRAAEKLFLCGFGAHTEEAQRALPGRAWASKWSRCARRWARRERTTRGCWDTCGRSRGTTEMKIPINLASQPFRRDRPMMVAAVAVVRLLLVAHAGRADLARARRPRAAGRRARATSPGCNRQIRRATAEQAEARRRAAPARERRSAGAQRVPERAALSQGHQLDADFRRPGKDVPHNVRIISIRPFVNAQNQITLDMKVGSEVPSR